MLYLVRMNVHFPHDMPAAQADEIKAREKAYSQELQRSQPIEVRKKGDFAGFAPHAFDRRKPSSRSAVRPRCAVCA